MEYNITENIGLVPTAVPFEQLDAETERKLITDITDLWDCHVQAQNTVALTKEELKVVRQRLGERLHEMKQLLVRPGRNGQWSAFLQQHGIPRTTADRLVAGHARLLAPQTNRTTGALPPPTLQDIEKLFKAIRPKLIRILTTRESVYAFIVCLISRASLRYERRDEGILMFHPTVGAQEAPKVVAPKDISPAQPANGN